MIGSYSTVKLMLSHLGCNIHRLIQNARSPIGLTLRLLL